MTKFEYGGPERYAHQKMALKKMIQVGGVGALLLEPGLGKTSVTLDFASILTLKQPADDNGVKECRILVIAPLAAVDTWVQQAKLWVSPQVNFWAEAIGGSIKQRAEALAARGGQPFPYWDPMKPPRWLRVDEVDIDTGESLEKGLRITCSQCPAIVEVLGRTTAVRSRGLLNHLKSSHGDFDIHMPPSRRNINGVYQELPKRAEGWYRAWDWAGRASEGRHLRHSDGPDGLGTDKPRLIIEVINIDTLKSRAKVGSKSMSDKVLDGIRRYNPHLVVIDESHKIKSHSSNVSRLADRIGQLVQRRIILTGTVMPAGPLDVFGQWRFLDPYAFGDVGDDGVRKRATFQRFQSRFCVMGGYLGHQVIGYRNMDELQTIMGQRAAVVLKKDALDLPPVIETVVPVMLTATEKKAYMEMKKNLSVMFSDSVTGPTATVQNRLVQIMRLRQITAGHLPDDQGIVREIGASKADTIASLIHDTLPTEKRIVVFTLFKHELAMLKARVAKQGTTVETISGDTASADRIAIRGRFGDLENHPERIVLIAQIKTLSLAVNELVTAQNIIFASLSQQRDDLIQAIDRLNRIGQTGEKVNVWFAEAPGTIDGVIHQSHRDGSDLEQAVLNHVMQYNPQLEDDASV